MSINTLAVFCGSKKGNNPLYCEEARALGYILAQKNITLIYGGSNKGLMGTVANAVLEKNGKVMGIMPKMLTNLEHMHTGISQMHETQDMHSRKKMMYANADAALILPGGYGTMDELFEIITWNQLNIHDKKIIIMNIDGFYKHLLAHLQQMEDEDFLYKKFNEQLTVVTTAHELESLI